MKEYLFGLIGVAALAITPAFGQTPMALPAGAGGAPVAIDPQGACCTQGACCGQACCMPTKTVCAPEQYIKKTTKAVYTCGCEPFCVDYPFGLFRKCSCCGDRQPTPRTKKFLIKKVQTTECPAVKCVPVCVPACDQGCGKGK
jgi:hypothetical protein